MKKIVINVAALFAVVVFASCVSSKESAYRKAYEKAKADASEADFIFVGGSSYVVADLLSSFRKSK